MTEFGITHVPDSFAFLKTLSDSEVDVIITDPPYPKEVQRNLCSGSLVGKKSVPKYELSFPPLEDRSWIQHATVVAKRWVLSFCAVEDFGRYQDHLGEAYVRSGIWYKSNAMGQLSADRPAAAYEGIAFAHRTDVKKRWNGRGSYGIWRCNGTRGKEDRHENEKPVDLALKLVAICTERGETVLDPFCGSGAIGEACVRLGRNYIGLDWDRAWCDRARARLTVMQDYPVTDEYALSLCTMPKVAEQATEAM